MVRALHYISGLAMAAVVATGPTSAVPLDADDVERLPHTDIAGFDEEAPPVVLKFKPTLKVIGGCVPWPAVDKEGRVSKGLKNTGTPSGDCDGSEGQVYTRATYYRNRLAIMYSWYFPKDSPHTTTNGSGHRHDWEAVVVWVTDNTEDAELLGVAYSSHGGYGHQSASDLDIQDFLHEGHPKIKYFSQGFTNHEMGLTSADGGSQPAIHWESLTEAARASLNKHVFKAAVVPFSDREKIFQKNIEEAWSDLFKE